MTLLAGLLAPWPLLTTVNGLSRPLRQCFDELLREPWDVIQIEHSYSLQPYLEPLMNASRDFVLTEHNLESSLGGATYDRFPGWALPFVRFDQWRCRRWERKAFDSARQVVAVTETDAQAMRQLTSTPVDVVVNGVDSHAFAGVIAASDSQRVLFVGNYEYAPNLDAVEWMLEEIFPRVWQSCPGRVWQSPGMRCPLPGPNASPTAVSNGWVLSLTCPHCKGVAPCFLPRCATVAAPNSRCWRPWRPACRW